MTNLRNLKFVNCSWKKWDMHSVHTKNGCTSLANENLELADSVVAVDESENDEL